MKKKNMKVNENDKNSKKVKDQARTPHTILVVDDDEDLSRLIRKKLQHEGFNTEVALTGSEAIARLVGNTSTLLLLDYRLPDMTGLQVILTLTERKCRVPFIIITGEGDEKLAVEMMKLGARDYLVKQKCLPDLLPSIVKNVINQLETEKKLTEAEEALKRSEEKYRMLIDNMQDGVFIIQDAKIQFVNEAFARMLGYTVDEIIGKDFRKFVAAVDVKMVADRYFRRQAGEDVPKEYEFCMLHKDGITKVIVTINERLITYRDGVASIGMVKDITERRRAYEALRESEEKFKQFFENQPEYCYMISTDGTILNTNRSARETFGWNKEGLVGKPLKTIYAPECLPKMKKVFSKWKRTGKLRNEEMVIITKTGEMRTVLLSADTVKGKDGKILYSVSVQRDITERKGAEEALRKAHMETEQLLSSISSILIGVGPDDRITRWNAAAELTFGIAEEDVVGIPFLECKIQWDWSEVDVHISDCREKDEPTRIDNIRYTRPDGKEGFLDIIVNPIVGDTSKDSGYLLLGTKITKRKILESQLAQALKLESIGQLAAGIAHEINTPIQYVGDNTRFLQNAFGDLNNLLSNYQKVLKAAKEDALTAEKVAELETTVQEADVDYLVDEIPQAIEQTLEGVDRVANIVRAMKEFSHPGVEEKTAIDINKAIESTITISRNEWKYVAEMVTDFDSSLPLVPCLAGDFNQVILNMIINAAHAISDVVGGGSDGKGTITICTRRQGDWVEIRIADTGAEIPGEARPKIFDPFFTTKEVGQGTGQGLAISHNVIVEKHAGSITFETEMGKGTTFIIRLPLENNAE